MKTGSPHRFWQLVALSLALTSSLPGQNIVPLMPLPNGYRLDVQFPKGHSAKHPKETMRLRTPEGKIVIDFGRYRTIESSPLAPELFQVARFSGNARDQIALGIFDASRGQEVLPCGPYSYIEHVQGGVFIVGGGKLDPKTQRPERFGVFDTVTGQEVQPCTARALKVYPGKMLHMEIDRNHIALLDLNGREIAPQRYRWILYDPAQQLSRVSIKKNDGTLLHGYIDPSGRPLTPLHYTDADIFTGGTAVVRRDGLATFIDGSGREVIPPRYAHLTNFVDGIGAYAHRGDIQKKPGETFGTFQSKEWGLIASDGRELSPAIYEAVGLPSGEYSLKGKVYVKHAGRWLVLDPHLGDAALAKAEPAQPQMFHKAEGGFFFYGYAIPGGEVISPPTWEVAGNFDEFGHAIVGHRVKPRNKEIVGRDIPFATVGLIDRTGRQVLPVKYSVIEPLSPVRYAVGEWHAATKKPRVGVVDIVTGKIVLPPDYEYITRASDTLMAARQNGRVGLIDVDGRWHMEPRFQSISPFSENYAVVRDEKGYTWIDRDFKVVSERRYVWAGDFENGGAWIATGLDNWGRTTGVQRIDLAGNVLATQPDLPPPVYTARTQRCSTCGGSGGRFEDKENSSSYYVGNTLRNYEPGGGTGNFRTVNWKESVRIGNCFDCGGRGTR